MRPLDSFAGFSSMLSQNRLRNITSAGVGVSAYWSYLLEHMIACFCSFWLCDPYARCSTLRYDCFNALIRNLSETGRIVVHIFVDQQLLHALVVKYELTKLLQTYFT